MRPYAPRNPDIQAVDRILFCTGHAGRFHFVRRASRERQRPGESDVDGRLCRGVVTGGRAAALEGGSSNDPGVQRVAEDEGATQETQKIQRQQGEDAWAEGQEKQERQERKEEQRQEDQTG